MTPDPRDDLAFRRERNAANKCAVFTLRAVEAGFSARATEIVDLIDAATAMLLIVPGFGSEERAATIDLLRRQASAGKTFLDDTQRDLKAAHASPNDARGRGLKGEGAR